MRDGSQPWDNGQPLASIFAAAERRWLANWQRGPTRLEWAELPAQKGAPAPGPEASGYVGPFAVQIAKPLGRRDRRDQLSTKAGERDDLIVAVDSHHISSAFPARSTRAASTCRSGAN